MRGRAAGGSVRAGVGGAVALSKGATGGSVGGAVMTPTRPGEREREEGRMGVVGLLLRQLQHPDNDNQISISSIKHQKSMFQSIMAISC